MKKKHIDRRAFLGQSVTAVGAASLTAAAATAAGAADDMKVVDGGTGVRKMAYTGQADMPCGMIGNVKISRLILGSNMMGGGAHSRDLRYIGPLMRAYNTQEKLMETMALAESEGINTVSQGPTWLVKKYNEECGGNLQQLAPLDILETDSDQVIKSSVRKLVDANPAAIYVFGHSGDKLVRAGRTDVIAKALQYVRDEGLPAGVGGHSLHVVTQCEKHEIAPDFYFKTFHRDNYWSRTLKENRDEYCWYKGASSNPGFYNDNMWCMDPEQTADVMQNVKAPWIAFKVLAAGAIHPKMAFSYALRKGADFLVVGMFDFQVRENAKLVRDTLRSLKRRDRPWRA
jgi:hypothetical protein